MIEPPTFGPTRSYSDLLGDAEFWDPYARAALRVSGLAATQLVSGFTGTYPTLVGDALVIKLFGWFGDWPTSYAAELTANRAVATDARIRAPRVLASGRLFPGESEEWPFLIMDRCAGTAWRDADLPSPTRERVAHALGATLRTVHSLSPADDLHLPPDWLRSSAALAATRQRRWGSLPERLITQIDPFVSDYVAGPTCLVHGDVTEDHVFVDDGRLAGLIDWGDAMITDPLYELGALHLGAFAADRTLLAAFLRGYDWPVDDLFPHRALQVALMHQFDLFGGVTDLADASPTLDDLADQLWLIG